jgi:DNA primase
VSSVTDEIKARVDLVELIGRSVALKRAGSSYQGLCPFHTEKTPSFYVRPQTGSWHCFGCGKGGTAFDWLMEREQLEFGEALRQLAALTNVELPTRRDPETEDHARRLQSILARAQGFYEAALWGGAGTRARDYLARRGLSDETARLFGLGYAPPTGNGLLHYLQRDGYSEQELQAAGVIGVTEEEGRPYDFFRDRLLFPIRDAQGRTVAFGGRALEDGSQPKYLNSRDTLLFHKQETLFGLDLARKAIAAERQVVIVEGYIDAATAHQHGFRTVVATLGTAVTERHLRLLRRQVDEIVLALDADAAGQAATWRALRVAEESLREGMTPVVTAPHVRQRAAPAHWVKLRVLALPNAKDPDELIRADPQTWPSLVRAALPVTEFVIQRLAARHDLTTAHGKAMAAEEVAEVLAGIANPIEQDVYTKDVAERLGIHPDAVRQLVRRRGRGSQAPPRDVPEPMPDPAPVRGDNDDDYLLALLMRLRFSPTTPASLTVEAPEFMLAESQAVFQALGGPIPPELQPHVERARRYLPDVERLSVGAVAEEIERSQRRIRLKKLDVTKTQISALLREGAISEAEGRARLERNRLDREALDGKLSAEAERAGSR